MSVRQKVTFDSQGNQLVGLLEIPNEGAEHYALFAHCFTCGKDVVAASRIAKGLVNRGIAVLRFDFTGLGGSDGDFANTNFSSNIDDLVAAADHLRANYRAPSLLVGHSLGGAAVIRAAHRIKEVQAVATIGAPAQASHVTHQFSCRLNEIESKGEAEVTLGGRPFLIKKQFIDDIKDSDTKPVENLHVPILVMHSPVDTIVDIKQAEIIYKAAKHPKSFISLDDADHLLTKQRDAEYAADVIASWANRYLPEFSFLKTQATAIAPGKVRVDERNHRFARNVISDSHSWIADEPTKMGGDNLGPDPYEHLLAALGTCTSMTIRMYANRKKWPLNNISVLLEHERKHVNDCEHSDCVESRIAVLSRRIKLEGDLKDEQTERLLEIADRCPVHKTLEGQLKIETKGG
ncbi:bifunctional alpha/beta hydrolase/OsmC family protein [Pleionea sediminis]|uniref:bifunctional alpha/beta hydrolase/OsmC family protein n=1 Tax=Pleionea sediminis TaxID=2569479 RepID=UPI001FE7D106|nr:bifunctional alpha/beta hydrolase/OsmC family protein [Pleionea sediminis]